MSDTVESARELPQPIPGDASTGDQPSGVRRLVVGVTVAMAVILYLDRFCVSTSERYIKEDLGLTEFEMAVFISGFFGAYALAQVPAGWLGDRLGIRYVLAGYILLWSVFTGLMGLAQGAIMLLAMRLGCGVAQAGAFPASGSLLRRWVPFQGRGLASGLVALGGRIGAVIAGPLTATLMIAFVPLSTPVALEGPRILSPWKVAQKLVPPPAADTGAGTTATPAAHLWSLLSDDDRQSLRRIASEDPEMASTPASAQNVAEILNRLMARRELYDDASMGKLSFETEGVALLKRQQAGETLPETEQLRLNRFVLEGALRGLVGNLYVKGWRPVLYVYGLAGVAVAFLFWFVFRDWPSWHPWCNTAEQRLIAGVAPGEPLSAAAGAAPAAAEALPILAILKSRGLWLSSISQFGTNVAWLLLVTHLPRYLIEVHDVPILKRSFMVSLPPLAGIVGMLLGGRLTDWACGAIGLRWGRALPMGLTRFGIALAYLGCLWINSAWWAIALASMAFFFVDLGVAAVWAYMQDVGGRHVGSVLGWGNMWGNIGAFAAPYIYLYFLGEQATVRSWNTLFLLCAGMSVVSGIAALAMDANIPVEEPVKA